MEIYRASEKCFNDFKNRFAKLKNKEWFQSNEKTITFINKNIKIKKDNRVKGYGMLPCKVS